MRLCAWDDKQHTSFMPVSVILSLSIIKSGRLYLSINSCKYHSSVQFVK